MGTDCEKNGETAFCLKEGRDMGGKALVENISFVENLPWHSIYSRVFFAFFKKKEPKGKIPPFNTPLPP